MVTRGKGGGPSPIPPPSLWELFQTKPVAFVYYASERYLDQTRAAFVSGKRNGEEPGLRPESPLHDALEVGRLKFHSLFLWFKDREDIENEQKVAKGDLEFKDPQLEAVRRAVSGLLPGFSGLRIQRDPLHMVIKKGAQLLLLDQLSDGEKGLIALAADLARRLAMTHKKSSDPLQGEAIVLIDEMELHLHPSWQRRVIHDLRATFPNCQFIVTTHSPQVISEVDNDAVVLVKDFRFFRPPAPTEGRDSNAILGRFRERMDTCPLMLAPCKPGFGDFCGNAKRIAPFAVRRLWRTRNKMRFLGGLRHSDPETTSSMVQSWSGEQRHIWQNSGVGVGVVLRFVWLSFSRPGSAKLDNPQRGDVDPSTLS